MSYHRMPAGARVAVVAATLGLCGCQTASLDAPDSSLVAARTRGTDGTPLPPRDSAAARDWPPEFKRFLDEALPLFQRGNPEPTLGEFEARLGIRLIRSPYGERRHGYPPQFFRVVAPWTHRLQQGDRHENMDDSHLMELPAPPKRSADAGLRPYVLSFSMATKPATCINPYALAIYTGARFTNNDIVPGAAPKPVWPGAYQWGMFKRGFYGNYSSNMGFGIRVNASSATRPGIDASCVTHFRIGTALKPRRGASFTFNSTTQVEAGS